MIIADDCPDGWEGEGTKCYKSFEEKVDYFTAKLNCWNIRPGLSYLATAKEYLKNSAVQYYGKVKSNTWIGLDDWQHEGVFVWSDGTYSNWTNWKGSEPNNGWGGNEHCVIMDKYGDWKTYRCSTTARYVCEFDQNREVMCEDTTGVVDMDSQLKSCPDFIGQYGHYMCKESVVKALCCHTCSQSNHTDEVIYPDNYVLEVYVAADKRAFERFQSDWFYPLSEKAARLMMEKQFIENTFSYQQTAFQRDLNITLKLSRFDILDTNFQREYEDGNYIKGRYLLGAFKKWYKDNDLERELRFDLAVILSGTLWQEGSAEEPTGTGAYGWGHVPGVCGQGASSIRYSYGVPMTWYTALTHEMGHNLKLSHSSGGVMYERNEDPPGHNFYPRQIATVWKHLDQFWKGDTAFENRSPEFIGSGIQQSYIGTSCLRDTNPKVNPNSNLRPEEKNKDLLCRNWLGNTSYFCQDADYYQQQIPTGDQICNNLHCVFGEPWECYKLDRVVESTEGMECFPGKTCQGGRCLAQDSSSSIDCPVGLFGEFCERKCHCSNRYESCDRATGSCQSGCLTDDSLGWTEEDNIGWTGEDCQTLICPEGWSGLVSSGKCYKYINKELTYLEAKETGCTDATVGGLPTARLALVKTEDIHNFLLSIRPNTDLSWIGMDDLQTVGKFLWADGSYPVWYSFWLNPEARGIVKWDHRVKDIPWPYTGTIGKVAVTLASTYWTTRNPSNKYEYFCEVDIFSSLLEENKFCLDGDQLFVKSQHDSDDLVTCSDIISTYGRAACYGNYPVKNMKSVCCGTCTSVNLFSCTQNCYPTVTLQCPHRQDGVFPMSDGTSQSCMDYIQTSPDGFQLCENEDFRTFCCHACSVGFFRPFADSPSSDCYEAADAGKKSYNGTLSITKEGKTCQAWNSQTPHVHPEALRFPGGVAPDHNYCRNPDSGPTGPWCYTTDPDTEYQLCDVPKCADEVRPNQCYYGSANFIGAEGELYGMTCDEVLAERGRGICGVTEGYNLTKPMDQLCCEQCLLDVSTTPPTETLYPLPVEDKDCYTGEGFHYSGHLNITESGIPCQRWDADTPHNPWWRITAESFVDGVFPDNYCRHFSFSSSWQHEPWCYTTDPDVRWQLCDVPKCVLTCQYNDGNVNVDGSMQTCQEAVLQSGFSQCSDIAFHQTCCRECTAYHIYKEKECGETWKYDFKWDICYKISEQSAHFESAVEICENEGAELPMPQSQEEADFFWRTFSSKQWYGLMGVESDNGTLVWQWENGEPLTWSDWIIEDTAPELDHCAFATSAGWGKSACEMESGKKYKFMCVKPSE